MSHAGVGRGSLTLEFNRLGYYGTTEKRASDVRLEDPTTKVSSFCPAGLSPLRFFLLAVQEAAGLDWTKWKRWLVEG